jgi:hypothetical protein
LRTTNRLKTGDPFYVEKRKKKKQGKDNKNRWRFPFSKTSEITFYEGIELRGEREEEEKNLKGVGKFFTQD